MRVDSAARGRRYSHNKSGSPTTPAIASRGHLAHGALTYDLERQRPTSDHVGGKCGRVRLRHVGAGSAGCFLANRISEDPEIQVLLIEAGGEDSHPFIKIPKGFAQVMDSPRTAWHFPVQPFGPTEKAEVWPRGKVLGGSSSINGMVYNRGNRADYDALVRLGNPGWGLGNRPRAAAGQPAHLFSSGLGYEPVHCISNR